MTGTDSRSSSEDWPSVSVMLPVYNAEPYLAEAIRSILDQTFTDFELIAIDDGSTDRSLEILRRFEACDPRMRVVTRENRGLVATLNEMIEMARGRYLARMDADDVSLPDRFEKQVAFLDGNPASVAVGGCIGLLNERGGHIDRVQLPRGHEEIDVANLKGHVSIAHAASIIRATVIRKIGGYSHEFPDAEDLDLWLRLAELGKLANLPDLVLWYRLHPTSVSEARRDQQRESKKAACELAWARRGIDGEFSATGHWRPGDDTQSQHEFALRYGWAAWRNGFRDTWWTYARQAIGLKPFSAESWRLLVFGLIKRPKMSAETES